MKERPILFSGPMVRAILEGRKTQTRRIVKSNKYADFNWVDRVVSVASRTAQFSASASVWRFIGQDEEFFTQCPYGLIGDRIWVRETWADYFDGSKDTRLRVDDGWRKRLRYKVCCDLPWESTWRPSIHMPRWASRITLEVTGVRVERLNDISREDAMSEGIFLNDNDWWDCGNGLVGMSSPEASFRSLWESINGQGSWAENPWVWVVEFNRVEDVT